MILLYLKVIQKIFHVFILEYNNFYIKIIKNYDKIRSCIFNDLSKRQNIEYTDFRYMNFCVDNKLYLKIMLFLDVNQISFLSNFLNINPSYKEKIYFICFRENENYLKELIKDCHTIIIENFIYYFII